MKEVAFNLSNQNKSQQEKVIGALSDLSGVVSVIKVEQNIVVHCGRRLPNETLQQIVDKNSL